MKRRDGTEHIRADVKLKMEWNLCAPQENRSCGARAVKQSGLTTKKMNLYHTEIIQMYQITPHTGHVKF